MSPTVQIDVSAVAGESPTAWLVHAEWRHTSGARHFGALWVPKDVVVEQVSRERLVAAHVDALREAMGEGGFARQFGAEAFEAAILAAAERSVRGDMWRVRSWWARKERLVA